MNSWCEISKNALQNNYKLFRDLLAPCKIAPVLKANAYGHGLKEVYEALAPLAPPILCINYLFEARKLRELGYKNRIISVGPSFSTDFQEARELGVEITLGGEHLFDKWLQEKEKGKVHLKFDTGLSRQGLYPEKASFYSEQMKPFSASLAGIGMHFANVEDVTRQSYAFKQLDSFQKVEKTFRSAFGESFDSHTAASAPALLMRESRFNFSRVGISLYGFWPSDLTRLSFLSQNTETNFSLARALTWKTKISSVREVKKGTPIGYGCTYQAPKDMKIGVIPVGYYEGFPRHLSNSGAYVLVAGNPCPLVGRVCMNMSIIDLSPSPEVEAEEEVTLIGKQGEEEIYAEKFAAWGDTIQYEAVTRIHERIERQLV